MLTNRLCLTSILLGSTLVACSSDGGTKLVDAPKQIDAAAIDSPAMVACPAATFGMGSVGTAATPAMGNVVRKTMSGAIFFGLGVTVTTDKGTAVNFIWPKPTAGFAAGTYPFDSNPASTMPVALSFFEGPDLDPNNAMKNAAHFLWSSNGTLTITSVTKTGAMPAGENPNDVFTGSVSATMYREIDANNAVIPGGCTVALAGLSFVIKDPNGSAIPPGGEPSNYRDAHAAQQVVLPAAE